MELTDGDQDWFVLEMMIFAFQMILFCISNDELQEERNGNNGFGSSFYNATMQCLSTSRFRGPAGVVRGENWPAEDPLAEEQALLDDPRVRAGSATITDCGIGSYEGFVWADGVCKKPLVDLPDSWIMQFANETLRRCDVSAVSAVAVSAVSADSDKSPTDVRPFCVLISQHARRRRSRRRWHPGPQSGDC